MLRPINANVLASSPSIQFPPTLLFSSRKWAAAHPNPQTLNPLLTSVVRTTCREVVRNHHHHLRAANQRTFIVRDVTQNEVQGRQPIVSDGGNKPFKKKNLKWTADLPITVGQLQSQRDAFWDTAPSYEGRREIWEALRAAAEAEDLKLAQSILDAANITLPTGNPADGCYDELGNRYHVPLYCLVEPTNLIRNTDGGDNEDESSSANAVLATRSVSSSAAIEGRDILVSLAGEASSSSTSPAPVVSSPTQPTPSTSTSISSSRPSFVASSSSTPVPTTSITATSLADGDHPILIRLSSGRDIPISILSDGTETVLSLRMRVYAQAEARFSRETHSIRFFYLGRMLEDKMRILADQVEVGEAVLGSGFAEKGVVRVPREGVVQALVSERR